jgi:hypothetical protein
MTGWLCCFRPETKLRKSENVFIKRGREKGTSPTPPWKALNNLENSTSFNFFLHSPIVPHSRPYIHHVHLWEILLVQMIALGFIKESPIHFFYMLPMGWERKR